MNDAPRLLGMFSYQVLAAVASLQPDRAYGLAIQRLFRQRTGRAPAASAIYVTLDRLERAGLVLSSETEPRPVRGGRRRRVYRLTDAGASARAETARSLSAMGHASNPGRHAIA